MSNDNQEHEPQAHRHRLLIRLLFLTVTFTALRQGGSTSLNVSVILFSKVGVSLSLLNFG